MNIARYGIAFEDARIYWVAGALLM